MSSIIFSQQNKDIENTINCKYCDTEEMKSINNLNHKNAVSLFHTNTCSFLKNIEELDYLLDKTKIDFDLKGISESKIKKDKSSLNRINLKDYSYESCPTKSTAGYISNRLSYKPRNDLCIYN